MARIDIDASELVELSASFTDGGSRAGRLANTAVRKTAHDIAADAKSFAPVDTGNLKNSIGTDATAIGGGGNYEAVIGPTASYGVFLETGTSRMAAQPFMGPAADRRIPAFIAAMEQIAESAANGT